MFNPDENRPTDWFEELYAGSGQSGAGIPWASMEIHPEFKQWLTHHHLTGQGKTALVVGCGMGDDAIALEALGFKVTAFDVSESAIKYCQQRFPESSVDFCIADLFESNPQWQQQFDFVLEIFTVQALPPKYEKTVIEKISDYVAIDGQLLVVAIVSQHERSFEVGPPWALTPAHRDCFVANGLHISNKAEKQHPQSENEIYTTTFTRHGLSNLVCMGT